MEVILQIFNCSGAYRAVQPCNRVPALTDQVKLNHTLTVPNAYVAKALTIRYETGATLAFGVGASLKMGN